MVRITEIHESADNSMERLNLDEYHSDEFDEYLFNANMETMTTTDVSHTLPYALPRVPITIKLEDEEDDTKRERHRLWN